MDNIVPQNIAGKQNDLHYTIVFSTKEEAVNCFKRSCKRLLNPPVWHELSGTLSPSFQLVDSSGNSAHRLAQVHDYYEIDIPLLGNRAGDGYDWVEVTEIVDETNREGDHEHFGMTLSVFAKPGDSATDAAHFFKSGATSSFLIERLGNEVTANYFGRNELPNTDTYSIVDNMRNAIVASGGFVGLSEAQWQLLLESLLQEELGG